MIFFALLVCAIASSAIFYRLGADGVRRRSAHDFHGLPDTYRKQVLEQIAELEDLGGHAFDGGLLPEVRDALRGWIQAPPPALALPSRLDLPICAASRCAARRDPRCGGGNCAKHCQQFCPINCRMA